MGRLASSNMIRAARAGRQPAIGVDRRRAGGPIQARTQCADEGPATGPDNAPVSPRPNDSASLQRADGDAIGTVARQPHGREPANGSGAARGVESKPAWQPSQTALPSRLASARRPEVSQRTRGAGLFWVLPQRPPRGFPARVWRVFSHARRDFFDHPPPPSKAFNE
jgi:hypothetical protein